MERVDADTGSWIRPRLTGRWGSVTAVVPDGYDAYVRILHPISSRDGTLRWRDVARVTGRRVHPLVQWWRLIDAKGPLNPVSDLWDGSDPKTGELLLPAANALYQLLIEHTATPDVTYFGFWTGYSGNNGIYTWIAAAEDLDRIAHQTRQGSPDPLPTREFRLPGREYGLLVGSLEAAPHIAGYLDESASGPTSPNLMWPNDRQWFLASEIDFDSTLVACSAEIAHAIISSDKVEAYVVQPNDSLQADADLLNA